MTPEPPAQEPPVPVEPPAAPLMAAPRAAQPAWLRSALFVLALVAVAALGLSTMLWQRLSTIQEQLARQSADSGNAAVEARALAKQAQDLARETAARQAVAEARVSEVTLQRTQLEELMQSLSRSRDENLVVDIESSLRLAQQQAQLTGSLAPLLAALKTADQRVSRAAQPRLAPLQRAIARDTERIKAATVTDTPGLLAKLDDLVRAVDDLPLVNAVATTAAPRAQPTAGTAPDLAWWERGLELVRDEARKLLRVSRIEQPEAVLLSPEQAFFVRENVKLKFVNARLGVLARQHESARADLASASAAINKYFDPASRRTQAAATLLQQVQAQMKAVELPRVDETFAALATAAAGR